VTSPELQHARSRLGPWLLFSLAIFWGVNWPAIKFSVNDVPVWTYRTICLLSGGLGLLGICRLAGISIAVPRKEWRSLAVAGFFNITGWHLLSALGVSHMGAGKASIVAFTMPLWAALVSALWLKEKITGLTLTALVVGFLGLAVLVAPDWQKISAQPLGPIFMLGAALSWAIGTVALKRSAFTIPTASLAGWQMLLGGIPIYIGALIFDRGFDPAQVGQTAWIAVAYSALVPMIYCHWAWFRVVQIYPAVIAAIGTLAIPVVGVISSAAVGGESIGWPEVVSLTLVLASLVLVLIVPNLKRGGAQPVPEPE
jgi:drug/metabolite transporter (DMT)-like permease